MGFNQTVLPNSFAPKSLSLRKKNRWQAEYIFQEIWELYKPVELVWRLFKCPGTKIMKYFFNNKRQGEKGALPSTLSYLHKTVPMSSCMQGMRGWLALSWEEELSFHSRGTCPICGWEANMRPHRVSTTGVRQGPIAERDKTHSADRSHCWCTRRCSAPRTLLQGSESSWPLHLPWL